MLKMRRILFVLLACFPFYLFGQETIENLEVTGNKRIPRRTILYYFNLGSGYSFDAKSIQQGIEALWDSGLFADIKVRVKRDDRGQVIVLSVDEYPLVKNLVYDTEKKLKKRDILDRLEDREIDFKPYSAYDPQKIHKIKQTIEGMLKDKGFDNGSVSLETREVGEFEVEVIFHIREGARYKIGEIIFKGNPELNRNTLLSALQFNQEHGLLSWLKRKDIFRRAKLDEDLENLKKKYLEFGYPEARIGAPVIEEYPRKAVFEGVQPMKRIVVPVEAGERYYIGDIHIEGNEHISLRQIRCLVRLEKGDIYNGKIKNQAIDRIKEHYQNAGYFFVKVISFEYLNSKEKKVDITFDIREEREVYLRRLRITGNTFTEDPLLRRQILVSEQQKFRSHLFEKSQQKLVRLGLARIEEPPEIKPDPENPALLDVELKLIERYRNEWNLTGGYSGYQGPYIGGNVSLVDFLGAGEQIDLLLEYGEKSQNYIIGFLKPYLFDRLFSFRSRFFDRDIFYADLFKRSGQGIQVGFDMKIKDYWWAGLGYEFDDVRVDAPGMPGNGSLPGQNISRVSAFLTRDTVDNPFFPAKGTRVWLSAGYADSVLGSDISFLKTEIEAAVFFPFLKRHVFGLHLEYRSIGSLEDSEIPFWERFYLGGERSLRGYTVYSIGPRSPDGKNVGGERSLVFNLEYIVPLFGPLYSIFFFDTGNAFRYSEKIDLREFYWSAGLEMRLRIPIVTIPLRFIFAYNNRLIEPGDSHLAFRIAFGASF